MIEKKMNPQLQEQANENNERELITEKWYISQDGYSIGYINGRTQNNVFTFNVGVYTISIGGDNTGKVTYAIRIKANDGRLHTLFYSLYAATTSAITANNPETTSYTIENVGDTYVALFDTNSTIRVGNWHLDIRLYDNEDHFYYYISGFFSLNYSRLTNFVIQEFK